MADIATGISSENDRSQPGILAVHRKSVGDVIGYCGLLFHDHGAPGEPELAYELLRRAHGLGYATEAGLSVVAWTAAAGYQRLWATVRAWNAASRRVLEKLGFCETGQVESDTIHGDSLLTVRNFAGATGADIVVSAGEDDPDMPDQPNGFDYELIGDDVVIRHHGRRATTLRGTAAVQFMVDVRAGDPQQLMARVTGNYRHGNERTARNHPRNQ